MKRQIVRIDESLCNGCGLCVTPCAEGAIELVNGKARVVSDELCDGAGFCLAVCPTGALTIEEREAVPFDEHAAEAKMEQRGQTYITQTLPRLWNGRGEPGAASLPQGGREPVGVHALLAGPDPRLAGGGLVMPERATPAVPLYDGFDDYDRFVNWERRLAYELPFIEAQLQAVGARRVLDVACGTGQHALALAQRGYRGAGRGLERGDDRAGARECGAWLEPARRAANRLPARRRFSSPALASWRAADERLGVDALLCLGSSLPHVLTEADLRATLADWHAALRPGGLLFVQNRNMDAVLARRDRWMPVQQRAGGRTRVALCAVL